MKLNLRFFLSWIFTSVIMFSLFYIWHGFFLNDFKRIQFPYVWFVSFAAFTYLILSFGLVLLFESQFFRKVDNFFFRGIFSGAVVGFSLFMIMTVLHISFTSQFTASYLLIDCAWQVAEQVIGGLVIATCWVFIPALEHEKA